MPKIFDDVNYLRRFNKIINVFLEEGFGLVIQEIKIKTKKKQKIF